MGNFNYKHLLCAIYNKIKKIIQFIMLKYLKYFTKHEDYVAYINSLNKVLPNVSFCEDNKETHYSLEKRVFTKFNANIGTTQFLYVDDFPNDVCQRVYDNNMSDFKQDFIDNLDKADKYKYTGETFEYNNNEYYLWEYQPKEDDESAYQSVLYLITDTLDFTGHTLEENINNDYCPFVAQLSEDKQVSYLPNEFQSDELPLLIATRKGVKLVNDVDAISEIKIDGVKLPNVVEYYDFGDDEDHDVEFTFTNPSWIMGETFQDCIGLTSIKIPKSVKYIGNNAFQGSGLTGKLIIPNNVETIEDDAFSRCAGLTSVEFSNNITGIPDGAFAGCTGLTGTLVIPDNIVSVGDNAFADCSSITGLQIGKGLCVFGPDPFLGCVSLETIVVDENNECYDSRNNCNAIIEVDTSDVATLIVGSKNTNIPNTIDKIGNGAFAELPITSITIPSNITEIYSNAFSECSQLASVTVEATTPPRLLQDVFRNNASGRKIFVPSASLAAYQAASGWSDYAADIEAIS